MVLVEHQLEIGNLVLAVLSGTLHHVCASLSWLYPGILCDVPSSCCSSFFADPEDSSGAIPDLVLLAKDEYIPLLCACLVSLFSRMDGVCC